MEWNTIRSSNKEIQVGEVISDKMNIGIIGGMGPKATIDLYKKIIIKTNAESDQENLHILIDSNPDIPDRTQAIVSNSMEPVYAIIDSAHKLERMGANILVMACNTAYYFYDFVKPLLHVPMLHMPDETARYCYKHGYARVCLLATTGTVVSGVYERALRQYNIKVIKPEKDQQKSIMRVIYQEIKANKESVSKESLMGIISDLSKKNADAFILGCTELPLVFSDDDKKSLNLVDPTEIAAEKIVNKSRKEEKNVFRQQL